LKNPPFSFFGALSGERGFFFRRTFVLHRQERFCRPPTEDRPQKLLRPLFSQGHLRTSGRRRSAALRGVLCAQRRPSWSSRRFAQKLFWDPPCRFLLFLVPRTIGSLLTIAPLKVAPPAAHGEPPSPPPPLILLPPPQEAYRFPHPLPLLGSPPRPFPSLCTVVFIVIFLLLGGGFWGFGLRHSAISEYWTFFPASHGRHFGRYPSTRRLPFGNDCFFHRPLEQIFGQPVKESLFYSEPIPGSWGWRVVPPSF